MMLAPALQLKQLSRLYKLAYLGGFPNLADSIRLAIPLPPDFTPANGMKATAFTDGTNIYFSEEFVGSLTDEEALGVFQHEYYHIIYNHVGRSRGKHPLMWNLAADVIVNDAVKSRCGFALPASCVFRGQGVFSDLPAELTATNEIYNWLLQNKCESDVSPDEREEAEDHASPAEGQSYPRPANGNKGEEGAAEANKKAGQLADKNSREVAEANGVRVESAWMDLVGALRVESGRLVHRVHQRSYRRPARYEPEGLIRPCFTQYQHHPKVDVYIDVSGSMGDAPLTIFEGLKSILSAMRIYRPRFFTFNTDIFSVDVKASKFNIGGGTDIKKVLHKIAEDHADLAILITDCEDNISVDDIESNVIVVSNNTSFADYVTNHDWRKVKKHHD